MLSGDKPAAANSAYARAVASLEHGDAAAAERQLRAILAASPEEVNTLRVLGLALLAQGRAAEAATALQQAVAMAPDFVHAQVDLAHAYRIDGRLEAAAEAARQALRLDPRPAALWRLLGDLLVNLGRYAEARDAFDRAIAADPHAASLLQAGTLLNSGRRQESELIFRKILQQDQDQVGALCGLAAISLTAGFTTDAERLLRHALRQSAHLPLIRRGLAQTYLEAARYPEAEAEIRHALVVEADTPSSWVILGTLLAHTMRQEAALEALDRALAMNPRQVRVLLSKGHVLKTLGRRADCEATYRQCLALQPDFAEGYYSLADLKNYVFSDAELGAMQGLTEAAFASPANVDPLLARAQLQFAIGRAYEQREDFDAAFAHYAAGNSQRRRIAAFDAAAFEGKSRRVAQFFDAPYLDAHAGAGAPDEAPIFIVGLPRSGSTLVEQVLASHSRVEGTMELPNLLAIVREFDHEDGRKDRYPESLSRLQRRDLRALGERYLAETRIFRRDRPYFIDKMPNNFSHVGLIQLILPKAKIIDVRRDPMDACFSAYKQYFAKGQAFTYDLEDLGRYYRTYVDLMDHWDAVLPGRVLRVRYEDLVRDTETLVQRLLAYCGLPYESACLRFHETKRAVRTASSEQVRLPIYTSGIGHWRHFAAHLEPLRRSLGTYLER